MNRPRRSGLSTFVVAVALASPAAATVTLAAAALSACGASSRSSSSSRDAIVRFTCNVAEASLFVDGRFLAPVGLLRGGVALSPGAHRIELRHDDYLPRFFELTLAASEKRQLDAQLFPLLPQ